MSPNLTSITIIGDIDEVTALQNLAFLKKWENKKLEIPTYNKFPALTAPQILLVNQDYAKQTNLTMGFRSIPSEFFGDFYKASIMNFALGGAFNSRLNLNIREDKGWTYGIRSGFRSPSMGYPSSFIVSAGVKASATDSSIIEVLKELKNYAANGITDEELDFTKKSLLGSDALRYESPSDKLGFLSTIVQYNLDRNYNAQRAEIVKNITKDMFENINFGQIAYGKLLNNFKKQLLKYNINNPNELPFFKKNSDLPYNIIYEKYPVDGTGPPTKLGIHACVVPSQKVPSGQGCPFSLGERQR
jgi:zinc protease